MLDPRLMRNYNVTMQQVEDAIEASNANVGGDILQLGSQSHNVRVIGLLGEGVDPLDPTNVERGRAIEAEKLDDIGKVVVTAHEGHPLFVKQLAQVIVSHRPRLGIVGRGGENDVV